MRRILTCLAVILLFSSMFTMFQQHAIADPGDEGVIFFDDFNDGNADGWSEQLGTWSVINGEYHVRVGTYENGIATVNGLNLTDCIIETKLRFGDLEEGYRAGIVFRYNDSGYYYAFEISNEYEKAELIYYTPTASGYGYIFASVNYTVQTNVNYTLKVKVDGNTFTGYINGDEVVSGTNANLTTGKVGLRARCGDVFYDDFRVYAGRIDLTLSFTYLATHSIIDFDVNDVDGDGKFDIALCDSPPASTGTVYLKVLHSNGTDLWNKTFSGISLGSPRLVDLNKDGKADVIVAGRIGSNTVMAYDSNSSLLWARSLSTWVDGISYGNFDGDEKLDIVAGTWGDIRAWNYSGGQLWRYTGTTFSSAPSDVADLDGDHLDDVIVGTDFNDGRLHCLSSNGTLIWTYGSVNHEIRGYAACLDNDQKSDVLAVSKDGYVRGIRSNGSLLFEKSINWSTILFKELHTRPSSFSLDYNSDGIDDLVFSNGTKIYVLSGANGEIIDSVFAPSNVTAGAIADMDNDGLLDFVIAGSDGIIYVLTGDGDIICNFTVEQGISYRIDIADMNADGLRDIIAVANHTKLYVITSVDISPPQIGEPVQNPPPNNVQAFQNVTVTINVIDYGTGIKNVTLLYNINNGEWINSEMVADSANIYRATIPGYDNCTWVSYKIVAWDKAGNKATKDNNGYYYKYHVIPEFPSTIIMPLFMILSILVVTFAKRKLKSKPQIFLNLFLPNNLI